MSVDGNVHYRLKPNPYRHTTGYPRSERIASGLGSNPETPIGEYAEKYQHKETPNEAEFFPNDGKDEIVVSGWQEQMFLPAVKQSLTEPTSNLKPEQCLPNLIGFLLVRLFLRPHPPTSDLPPFPLIWVKEVFLSDVTEPTTKQKHR